MSLLYTKIKHLYQTASIVFYFPSPLLYTHTHQHFNGKQFINKIRVFLYPSHGKFSYSLFPC